MTAESPSSKKVDDFLSLLSQLSQERLKQDQQRQRELERTIGDLKQGSNSPIPISTSLLTSSISKYSDAPLMRFSRNNQTDRTPPPKPTRPKPNGQTDSEDAPKLPQRRAESPPPALPRRRDESPPPTLPKRRDQRTPPPKPTRKAIDYTIELVEPVARSSKPEVIKDNDKLQTTHRVSSTKPLSPNTTLNKLSTGTDKKYRSFTDVENTIKGDYKPMKPAKADWLTSSMTQKKITPHNSVPKPSYLQALSASQNSKPIESSPPKEPSVVIQKYVPNSTDVSIVSPTREKKSTSWIDSAISKSPTREKKIPPVIKSRNKDLGKKLANEFQGDDSNTVKSGSEIQTEDDYNKRAHPKDEEIQPKQPPVKPLKLSVKKPSYNDYKQKDNELLLSQLAKIKNKPAPVVPKPHTKPKSLYETHDTEELKSKIGSLSPTRSIEQQKALFNKYKKEDTTLLNAQISRLGKVDKPEIAKKPDLSKKPEMLEKTEMKKPEVLKKPEVKKPEAKKPEAKKPEAPKKPQSQKPNTNPLPEIDFKSHLSSLIRAGTAPQIGAAAPLSVSLKRSDSSPTASKREDTQPEGKLHHMNKTRAKGPKRRLPKSLNTEVSSAKLIQDSHSKDTKTPPVINKASKPKFAADINTSLQFKGDVFI